MDEVFGSKNFVGLIWFRKKTMPLGAKHLERMGDYILWFSKNIDKLKFNRLYAKLDYNGDSHWNWREESGRRIKYGKKEIEKSPPGEPLRLVSMWPPSFSPKDVYSFPYMGKGWEPPSGACYPTRVRTH
jgi:adenine-specific DNA-methyltransferase